MYALAGIQTEGPGAGTSQGWFCVGPGLVLYPFAEIVEKQTSPLPQSQAPVPRFPVTMLGGSSQSRAPTSLFHVIQGSLHRNWASPQPPAEQVLCVTRTRPSRNPMFLQRMIKLCVLSGHGSGAGTTLPSCRGAAAGRTNLSFLPELHPADLATNWGVCHVAPLLLADLFLCFCLCVPRPAGWAGFRAQRPLQVQLPRLLQSQLCTGQPSGEWVSLSLAPVPSLPSLPPALRPSSSDPQEDPSTPASRHLNP